MKLSVPRALLVALVCAVSSHVQAAQPAETAAGGAKPAAQSVTVRDAWARATAPGMAVGAVYLTLRGGAKPDSLVAAATSRASMTQIHVTTEAEGMARMRETDAVDVPAGKDVRLAPQGTHIMLMGLEQPLVAGERFTLTLTFVQAGALEITVQVVAPGAEPPPAH